MREAARLEAAAARSLREAQVGQQSDNSMFCTRSWRCGARVGACRAARSLKAGQVGQQMALCLMQH